MTAEQLEAKLKALITYTKQLASQHNALEQKVDALENLLLGLKTPKALAADEQ